MDQKHFEELLSTLDKSEPAIPDDLINYYLHKAGFNSDDPRLSRFIGLAAQKFITDIASDALQHARVRQKDDPASKKRSSSANKAPRLTLTVEDLASTARDYGIDLRKPEYFADTPAQSSAPAAGPGAAAPK